MTRHIIHRRLIARVMRELGWSAKAVAKTGSLAYPMILWRVLRSPRFTPGNLRIASGRVRYLDAVSLLTTYRQIFVEGIYQVEGLGATPKIIDCGGNVGLSVSAFKRRYPQARILTFEADPTLAATLAQNVKSLGLANITVESKAVAGVNGDILFQPNGADGGHVVAPDEARAIRVPGVRLSDLIDGPVDLLKLDIEGSEYDVIADLSQSGKIAQVKRLICEVHGNPSTQHQFAELWERLNEAGFRLSLGHARAGGSPGETPFLRVPGVYYAVLVYAWRP
ncbi:MAG TPA: FkbM family methyltransferase [Ktedonobacterales bacterium]